MRLAVSGEHTLFTLGLPVFALPLVDFLSLVWSPSTNIEVFHFCQKYYLRDTNKIFDKKSCSFITWMVFVGKILIDLWSLPFEVFFSCPFDLLLGVTYVNTLVATRWPLKHAPHLTCLGLCAMEAWKLIRTICPMLHIIWYILVNCIILRRANPLDG